MKFFLRTILACLLAVVSVSLWHQPCIAEDTEHTSLDTNDGQKTVLCLNYTMDTLSKIVTYNDIAILDSEYNNIINNINLAQVQDREIVELYEELMDILTRVKISDKQKEFVARKHGQQVANAVNEAFGSARGLMVVSADPYTLALQAVARIGSSYFSYKRQIAQYNLQREESEWRINEQVIQDLNSARKKFFTKSWELIQKYGFPDKWRLTESQLEAYVEALKDDDPERRLRKLERMEDDFKVYPPFWYYYGRTAQDLEMTEKASSCYEMFDEIYQSIFRKDVFLAAVAMNRIVLAPNMGEQQLQSLIDVILENSPHSDWSNYAFAAMQFAKIGDIARADDLLLRNVDEGYEISLNERLRAELHIDRPESEVFKKVVQEMLENANVSFQDILYLYGRSNDRTILRALEKELLSIQVDVSDNWIADDDLLLIAPSRWDSELSQIKVAFEGKSLPFSERRAHPESPNHLVYVFSECFDYQAFLEADNPVEMSFSFEKGAYPFALTYLLTVIKSQKEVGTIGKWLGDDGVEKQVQIELFSITMGNNSFPVEDEGIVFDKK